MSIIIRKNGQDVSIPGTSSGGGTGGHIILDDDGTAYTQRSKLKFVNCDITDDATNDTTIVEAQGGGGGGSSVVPIPTVTVGTYTYNGQSQGPTIDNFAAIAAYATKSGDSAVNAGSYTLTLSLKNVVETCWDDGTTESKTWAWSIGRAEPTLTVNPDALTLTNSSSTGTSAVTYNGDGTITASSTDTDVATASYANDTVTVTGVDGGTATVNVSASQGDNYASKIATINIVSNMVKLVSWANGTDAQIAALVAAADRGDLDLYNDAGWRIGDERTVHLSAMAATGVGEAHDVQDVVMVLMDRGHYTLNTAKASGRTVDDFVVGMKDDLVSRGYMNSSNTSEGSWNGCARRTWCNNVFRAAIPETLRGIFKQFKVITAQTYNGTTNQTSVDYFALFAEKEIHGTRTYSNATEANALSQIEYYKTEANRIKKWSGSDVSGSIYTWWARSSYSTTHFIFTDIRGVPRGLDANRADGIAPFGCI